MTKTLVVIGKTGQLAQALRGQVKAKNWQAVFYDRTQCDLSQSPARIEKFIGNMPKPDALIIAAAYTNVDKAEQEKDIAYAVNADAPKVIARACARRNIALVHVSTDYVFDGLANTPYAHDHPTHAVNIYGASKLAGEKAVLKACRHAAIVRTSWVFGLSDNNFITTILRLANEKNALNIVNDQISRPTCVQTLAHAILHIADEICLGNEQANGVFHICGSGPETSRYEFTKAVFKHAKSLGKLPPVKVNPISAKQFGAAAQRPAYSVLDNSHFEHVFGYALPDWQDGLRTLMIEKYGARD